MTIVSLIATMFAILIVAIGSFAKGFSSNKVGKTSKKLEKILK